MKINANTIEDKIQNFLLYFIILIFITTIVSALRGYIGHNAWTIGDWLINYQGGVVRRGFLGEIIYWVSYFTHINPGIYVVFLQTLSYAVFLSFSYLLLKKQNYLLPYSFLIFSPFIFTFQINDAQGGFRKEIIYFALLAFVVWVSRTKEKQIFEKIFFVILLFYPIVILTHEMLAIYLPYLLVPYFMTIKITKKKFFLVCLFLIPSVLSFIIAIYYSGTQIQVTEIFNSIAHLNYSITGGAISWLDKDSSYEIERVINRLKNQYYVYYILIIPFAIFAYIPIYDRIKSIMQNKLSLLMILISIIGSIGLFVVAVDWGRFLYIHLVSIFLLSLMILNNNKNLSSHNLKQSISLFVLVCFIIYTFFWHIPHCGSPQSSIATSYKNVNPISFAKPYAGIIFDIFPNLKSKSK